jgi:hypothetical protein
LKKTRTDDECAGREVDVHREYTVVSLVYLMEVAMDMEVNDAQLDPF